jgi:hypothetical protein
MELDHHQKVPVKKLKLIENKSVVCEYLKNSQKIIKITISASEFAKFLTKSLFSNFESIEK